MTTLFKVETGVKGQIQHHRLVSQSLLKINVTLNSEIFLIFFPPLKYLSFTKPPSLKETLKIPLNFKEVKDLP